jgi:hypothetical protein
MTIRFQTAFASILLHYNRTTGMNRHTFNAASPHSEVFLAFPSAPIWPPANLVVAFLLSPIPGVTLCITTVYCENINVIHPLTPSAYILTSHSRRCKLQPRKLSLGRY